MQAETLYTYPHLIVSLLQHRLAERADPSYADWYRHNVKPTAPVRGVRMQDLRHLVMAWHQEWQQQTPSILVSIQLDVTFLLFNAEYVDDRLAAMVYLDEVLIPAQLVNPDLLPRMSTLFPPGLISDFKACDHFAAKVLQPLLIRYGSQVSEHLHYWFGAESVWQARAALSALTPLASDAIYDDLLVYGCGVVLARPEEEAKSIVGSALRALGKVRPELVETFLSENINLMNSNAACLNKATSFLEPGRAQHFREQRRMLLAWHAQMGATSGAGPSTARVPIATTALPVPPPPYDISIYPHQGGASERAAESAHMGGPGTMLPGGVHDPIPMPGEPSHIAPQYATIQQEFSGAEGGGDIHREVGRVTEPGVYMSSSLAHEVPITGGMQMPDHRTMPLGEQVGAPPGGMLPLGVLDAVSLPQLTDDGRGATLNMEQGRIQRTDSGFPQSSGDRRSRPTSLTASPMAMAATPVSLLPLGVLDPVSLPQLSDDGRGTPINVAHGHIQRTDSEMHQRNVGRRSRATSLTASPVALAAPSVSLLPLGALDPVSLPHSTDDGRGTLLNVAHGRIQRTDSGLRQHSGGRRSRPSSLTASPVALAAALAEEERRRRAEEGQTEETEGAGEGVGQGGEHDSGDGGTGGGGESSGTAPV